MTLLLREYRVADLMTVDPIVVRVDESVEEAERLMRSRQVSGLPVVDGEGALVGVISQTDLLWGPGLHLPALLRSKASELQVGELMSSPAMTCSLTTPITEAARIMLINRVHRLVAVDDQGRAVGVLSATDFVGLVADFDETPARTPR